MCCVVFGLTERCMCMHRQCVWLFVRYFWLRFTLRTVIRVWASSSFARPQMTASSLKHTVDDAKVPHHARFFPVKMQNLARTTQLNVLPWRCAWLCCCARWWCGVQLVSTCARIWSHARRMLPISRTALPLRSACAASRPKLFLCAVHNTVFSGLTDTEN